MAVEPQIKRAVVFVDGQNLYHCAREAFGCSHPNYDILKLARWVCQQHGWELKQARFYTGYPSAADDKTWNEFWQRKLLAISRQGVHKFARPLRYRNKTFKLGDGTEVTRRVAEEKGIDVRIAIDLIKLALSNDYDVAVIFSQDQDLSEATNEIKEISKTMNRWILTASAFPVGSGTHNYRGINGTQWIKIDEAAYNSCVDPVRYR